MYAHSCIPVRLTRVGVCVCVYSHYRPFPMQAKVSFISVDLKITAFGKVWQFVEIVDLESI